MLMSKASACDVKNSQRKHLVKSSTKVGVKQGKGWGGQMVSRCITGVRGEGFLVQNNKTTHKRKKNMDERKREGEKQRVISQKRNLVVNRVFIQGRR